MYELITEIERTNQNAGNAVSEAENLIISIKNDALTEQIYRPKLEAGSGLSKKLEEMK